MNTLDPQAREQVLDVLHRARDLSLATLRPDGYPQATTVSFINDGLALYAGVGLDSQKAHNIQHDGRVSLTVTLPYEHWDEIRGLSIGGQAHLVGGQERLQHVKEAFVHKFPQIREMMRAPGVSPWEGAIFIRIDPEVVSLLDYRKGFGHTELYVV